MSGETVYAYTFENPESYRDASGLLGGADLPPLVDYYLYHYFRNGLNNVPATMQEAQQANWIELPPWQSVYHQQGPDGKYNTKWLDQSGHCEAVYDKKGNLVTDHLNGGTYNYGSPNTEPLAHFYYDILPYYLWGNGPILVNPNTILVNSK